jgi:hypothetical protein
VLDQHHEFHRYVSFLFLGWAEQSEQLRLLKRSLQLYIERDEEKSTRSTIIFLDHAMGALPGPITLRWDGQRRSEQLSVPSAATTLCGTKVSPLPLQIEFTSTFVTPL